MNDPRVPTLCLQAALSIVAGGACIALTMSGIDNVLPVSVFERFMRFFAAIVLAQGLLAHVVVLVAKWRTLRRLELERAMQVFDGTAPQKIEGGRR